MIDWIVVVVSSGALILSTAFVSVDGLVHVTFAAWIVGAATTSGLVFGVNSVAILVLSTTLVLIDGLVYAVWIIGAAAMS